MNREELEAAARRVGVETSYPDILGVTRTASDEALRAVLDVLGDAGYEGAVDAVAVAWDGGPARLQVRAPDGARLRVEIETEYGRAAALEAEVAGGVALLPGPFPPGYHRLRIGGEEALLVSAPRESFVPPDEGRRRALFLPLYSLRTARAPAAGDYDALGDLAEWAGAAGGFQVATLPLFATFLDEPFAPSPYTPASRLFLAEWAVGPAGERAAGDHVDWRALAAARRREFAADPLDGPPEPELDDYAAFRAAGERRRSGWPAWESPAREGVLTPADYDEEAYRYHVGVQRAARAQLARAAARARAAGSGLQLDLPIGAGSESYDVWRHRDLFALGLSVGAPPDDFFDGGQDWGFPPLHPRAIRRDGYRYLRRCLSVLMGPADVVRIDHVLGIYRLFLVPRGMTAKDGVYVRYPAEELAAVLSLESHRHRCRIVGEDLGTVPVEVGAILRRHRFAGMTVVQFTARPDPSDPVPPIRPGDSVSLNTHDTPPFAAWARLPANAERFAALGAGEADPVAVHADVVSRLAASGAGQVVVNLEDLWGEERPQNWPGTSTERPNFSRSAARSLEEIRADDGIARVLGRVAAARETGRRRKVEIGPSKNVSRLTGEDLYFLAEGTHVGLGEKLGAHPGESDGEWGYWFATWAPSAGRVTVIGDFNGWDPDAHPLFPRGGSGVWEAFIPGVAPGRGYKFRIDSRANGYRVEKADPCGMLHETPPRTASVTWALDYRWEDEEWMASRGAKIAPDAPVSVYEVHLGSWFRTSEEPERFIPYRELAPRLAAYVKEMGFTHVEFLPVMAHPFYGSWGYQVTGFFAPSSRQGTPQDFMALVDHLHREGIGVILDWVPSHFPRDEHALGFYDGTHLYEHADPRKGVHPDWGGFIFNYGRHEVRSFLSSAAHHWLSRFHADGLRTDAVASMLYLDYSRKQGEWIPNEYGGRENLEAIGFLRALNEGVSRRFPDVATIAEESTAWPGVSRPTYAGGLGFGMKWDMGWMHDTLKYFAREPIYRKWHHHELTFRGVYAFTENFMLPLSHDEVVHGKGSLIRKMPGDDWRRFANLRLLYAWMWAQPGKKLLFMGGEFAQIREWNHDRSLDWELLGEAPHAGVRKLVRELNRLYRERPALHGRDFDPGGFEWVEANDAEHSVCAFLRRGHEPGETVLCVFNATPDVWTNYRLGVPVGGPWREILNADAREFGGSGVGNFGGVEAKPVPLHGRSHSVTLILPPLAAVWLEPAR